MQITNHTHNQLRDYLAQVKGFSYKEGFQLIKLQTIADRLHVSSALVSLFLNKKTQKSPKMLNEFRKLLPNEVGTWPAGVDKIQRILTKNEVSEFLGMPVLQLNFNAPFRPLQVEAPIPTVGRPKKTPITPVVISYRGHQTEKDAKGMLYDHASFQNSINRETEISLPSSRDVANRVRGLFSNAINEVTFQLRHGQLSTSGRVEPYTNLESFEGGLLVIPGRVRKIENEPVRLSHEYGIIRNALNRGQPLLGICAGAWRVFEQCLTFGNNVQELREPPQRLNTLHNTRRTLVDVQDHSYGGGMLRLNRLGSVTHNTQMHDIEVTNGSHLSSAMKGREENLPPRISVNSVHWKAVNPALLPNNIRVSALSKRNPSIRLNTRQAVPYEPQENSVEAFESIHGAPVMGIQWHPEGYTNGYHANVLRYLAQAGDAYLAKRRMLRQFTEKYNSN